ncbi:MAG: S41 family peptidase [Planctomycetota bacterium]
MTVALRGSYSSRWCRIGAVPSIALLFLWGAVCTSGCRATGAAASAEPRREIFDDVCRKVRVHFYDRSFRGLEWREWVRECRERVTAATTDRQLQSILNELLARLDASHTGVYTPRDPVFWALQSVFSHRIDGAPFRQIGAWFVEIDGQWFVRDVFEGSEAERSGLKVGDAIAGVGRDRLPFEPVRSFAEAETVSLWIRRHRGDAEFPVEVRPALESVQRSHLRAMRKSRRVIQHDGVNVGYVHLWSGTHEQFQRELALSADHFQRHADAMILDLRGGFGGAHPEFIEPFFNGRFTKPLFVLIDRGSRSGKEWIAHLLRKKRATLIGTRTQGAFLAGRWFTIVPGRFSLFLAVAEWPKELDLEGKGVPPHVEVPVPLPYRAGDDPVLRRALEIAAGDERDVRRF